MMLADISNRLLPSEWEFSGRDDFFYIVKVAVKPAAFSRKITKPNNPPK